MNGNVVLTGTIRCVREDAALLRDAIPGHVALTRAEPGCLAFEIRATDDPCLWEVAERFGDEAAFAAHQARARASDWWQATSHMARDFRVDIL